jgi:hypothetical protein
MLTRFRNWLAHQLATTAVALATDEYKEAAHQYQPRVLELEPAPQLALMPSGWEIEATQLDSPPMCVLHVIEMRIAIREGTPVGPAAPYYYCPVCTHESS